MVGEHDSVWTRIAAVAPHCLKMTCICHSLSLCVQHVFEKFPSSLGFLLAEIPKWFLNTTVEFWSRIVQFQTCLGDKPFKELATYALNCLTNPISNAVVERTFSLVTAVKTKQHNRMGLELLNAIIRIRSKLQFSDSCCQGRN